MITVVIVSASTLTYITGWTFTARSFFRQYRLHQARKRECPKRSGQRAYHNHDEKCYACRNNVLWWETPNTTHAGGYYSDVRLQKFAMTEALVWPVSGLIHVVHGIITHNPPLTEGEKDARIKALEADSKRMGEELDRLHES